MNYERQSPYQLVEIEGRWHLIVDSRSIATTNDPEPLEMWLDALLDADDQLAKVYEAEEEKREEEEKNRRRPQKRLPALGTKSRDVLDKVRASNGNGVTSLDMPSNADRAILSILHQSDLVTPIGTERFRKTGRPNTRWGLSPRAIRLYEEAER